MDGGNEVESFLVTLSITTTEPAARLAVWPVPGLLNETPRTNFGYVRERWERAGRRRECRVDEMRILWQSYTAAGSEYLRVLHKALQALAGHEVEVVVAGLDQPHAHIHRLSEARCTYQVVASNLDAAERGFDAVVVGHFQDGGVHELRAALDIPVVGLGEAALHNAMMLGETFGLVTINPGFLSFHREQVSRYRLDAKFAGVRAMDTDPDVYFAALGGDTEADLSVRTQFLDRARDLVDAGADVVIPAGGLPALMLFDGRAPLDLDGAALLDPLGVALGHAEMWARLGPAHRVRPGRRGPYARPSRAVLDDYQSLLQ
jgi:Asp/Glu/hydantoin racemase